MEDYRLMRSFARCFTSHTALLLLVHLMALTGQLFADSSSLLIFGPPPMTLDDIDPNCWNFTYGNWRIQEFYTPNYPGEYLNNTDCVLYLEAPPGFKIQLDFRDKFILEKSEGCKYDYLEVRDGPFAYSPLISRYCNAEFPPIITSSGRFLWMRFKTDDLLQYGGFRAIYSYQKDHSTSSTCRIPVKLSPDEADGVLSSDDAPFSDVHDPNVPKGQTVDCTWEIHANKGHGINLRSTELELHNRKRCDSNNVTIYERTTLESAVKGEYCRSNGERVDVTSDSNRVFVRLYGSSVSNRPNVKMIYTLVRKGECSDMEFRCGDLCLPASLICNGVDNCRDRSDEKGCSRSRSKDRTSVSGSGGGSEGGGVSKKPSGGDEYPSEKDGESSGDSTLVPLHIIILGAVGGVIITCVTISLCVMCILRKKDRQKRQEAAHQKSSQRNALEMAVGSSSNTTIALSRQNNESPGHRAGGGTNRQHYVTFSKTNPSLPGGGKEESNRYSMSDRGLPPMDPDSVPDQMTESGHYKRYLSMDITPDDIMVESKQLSQHGKYPPSPGGVIGMTNVDHRGPPDVYHGYHGNQWQTNMNADGIMYPYGSSSLTRPTPFLGLSKQFTYNQPDTKYESKFLKSLKTLENDTIKEHQSS